jgi:hypothetical protein
MGAGIRKPSQKQTSDIGKDKSDVAALLSMPINVDRSSEKPPAVILILHPVIAPI